MPTGRGRRPAPPGYLSAGRVAELLGSSRMYKVGLKKQTPPGLKHGYYLEKEVMAILSADKAFFEAKLTNLPTRYTLAKPSDAEGIYNLAVRIFGASTISAEKRRSWIEAERRGNYVVRRLDTNEILAYFYVQALPHERILQYLRECRGSTIEPDELLPIRPGQKLELIIGGIGRDPRADKQYAAALLHGFANDLERWAKEGIEISHLYAYSETMDGIYLSFAMGMDIWQRPRYLDGEGPFFTFVLDVEKSDASLLKRYKKALQEYRHTHGIASPEHATLTPVSSPHIHAPPQRKAPSRSSERQREAVQEDQPENTITLAELATQLGRNEKTLIGHCRKYDTDPGRYPELEHIRIPIAARPGQYRRYFTAEQAERFSEWLAANTKKATQQPSLFDE